MESFLLLKSKLEDQKNEDLFHLCIEQIIEIYKVHTIELNKVFLEMLLSFMMSKLMFKRNIASTIFNKWIDLFYTKFENNLEEFCENYIYIENKLNIMENFYKKSKIKPNFFKLNLDEIILNEWDEIKYDEIIFLLNDKKNYLYSKNEKSFNSSGSAISQINEDFIIEKINKNFENDEMDVDNLLSNMKKEVKTRGRKPNKNVKEDMIKFLKKEDKNSFIAQSILNKIVDYSKILIFNQKWEIRHGASLILMNYTNKIFKFIHLNKLNNKLLEKNELDKKDIFENINFIKVSKVNNLYINEYLVKSCIDLFKRSMLLLILDRFTDFLGDKSNTIVREISINTMTNIMSILIDDNLYKLTDLITDYILKETLEKTGFQSKQSLFNLNSKILRTNKDLNIKIIDFDMQIFNNHDEILESSCEYFSSIVYYLNNTKKENLNTFYLVNDEKDKENLLNKISNNQNEIQNYKNSIIKSLSEKQGEYYIFFKEKFQKYLSILLNFEDFSFLPYTIFLLYQEIFLSKKFYYFEFLLNIKKNLNELNKKYLFHNNYKITMLFQNIFLNLFSSKKYNINFSEDDSINIFVFYFLSICCLKNIKRVFNSNFLLPLKNIYNTISESSKTKLNNLLVELLETYELKDIIVDLLNIRNNSKDEKIEWIKANKSYIIGYFFSLMDINFYNIINVNNKSDLLCGLIYSIILRYTTKNDNNFLVNDDNKIFLNNNKNLSINEILNTDENIFYKNHPFYSYFDKNLFNKILEFFTKYLSKDVFKNDKELSQFIYNIWTNLNNNEFINLSNLFKDLKDIYLTVLNNNNKKFPTLISNIFINHYNSVFNKYFDPFLKNWKFQINKMKTITSCLFIYYYKENDIKIEKNNLNRWIIPLLNFIKNGDNNFFINKMISESLYKIIKDIILVSIKPCLKIIENLNLYYLDTIKKYISSKLKKEKDTENINTNLKSYNFYNNLLKLLLENKYEFIYNQFNNINFIAFYFDLINLIPNCNDIFTRFIQDDDDKKEEFKKFSYIKLLKKLIIKFVESNENEESFYYILNYLKNLINLNPINFCDIIINLIKSKKKIKLINFLKIFIDDIIKNIYNPNKEIRQNFMKLFSKIITLIHLRHTDSENLFSNLKNDFNKNYLKGTKFLSSFRNINIKEKKIDVALDNNKKFILRLYQKEAVSWLYNLFKYNLSGLLCDEMGLGKTIQSLITYKMLKNKKLEKNHLSLIIAPIILKHHWENEILELGGIKCFVVNKNTKTINKNVDFVICSYYEIKKFKEQFTKINFFLIIMDEIHLIKNPNTQLYKTIIELKSKLKLGLSGTPLQNNLLDLWSIFNIIMPDYLLNLKEFKSKYRKLFNLNLMNLDLDKMNLNNDQIENLEDLHKKILPFIMRRTKKDVLKDLPDKVFNDIVLDMTETQKDLYDKFKNRDVENKYEEGYTKKNDDKVKENKTKSNFLKDLNIMRNICNHPGLLLNSGIIKSDNKNYDSTSAKLNALVNLFDQLNYKNANNNNNDIPKMLIFSHSAIFITLLYTIIKEKFGHLFPLIFQSKLSSEERFKTVNNFQNFSKHKILLLTPQSGGLGWNLTSANIVLLMDHHFNPFIDMQAIDRTHRIGQKKVVYIYRFIMKNSYEEKVIGIQNIKKSIFNTIITEENKNLEEIQEKGNLYMNIEKNIDDLNDRINKDENIEDDLEEKFKNKISKLLKDSHLNKLWDENEYNKTPN